ncbi:protein split ends-like isoform X2 [Palaemon carinicauda]|uniref:protein split ends-like isoform X2 n=1 Tax=Palaemon carinicauda TaxID=392227 RepID=UPI0035B659E3
MYVEEKVVRRVGVSAAPISPPLSRPAVSRDGRIATGPKSSSRSDSESKSSSRSRSSSSSSSSSSSRSSTSSSSRSPSPKKFIGSTNTGLLTPVGGLGSPQEEKRPLAICVRNLPPWSTETSLREGLFHDYKKHGKVMAVRLLGSGNDRFAVVCFKKPEDAEKALDASREKLFFGVKIQVAPHEGVELDESECRAYDVEVDEYHPRATRTLFIGNLEKDVTIEDLKKHFEQFGDIIEIDIKKQNVSTFAFCQYSDIRSVVRAMRQMDGEHLGANRIKLGFGKSMPTRCVWIDGVPETLTDQQLYEQFSRYGPVVQTIIDKEKGHALITYDNEKYASNAVMEMRGRVLNGRKLQIDFASRECQAAFYENLSKQGHPLPADRPWERTREIEKDAGRYESTTNRYSRYDRSRREGVFSSRATANSRTATYSSTGNRSRGCRYDNFDEFAPGSYDEYSQGSGASYEDSYERELREYAGSQRFVDGVGNGGVTSTGASGSRRHSFSPARRRDDRSPASPRTHSRDRSSVSPPPRPYEDGETANRRTARRSTSDHESYSQSPPGSRTTSPPPPPRPNKSSSGVSSRLAPPPRSPGTPVTASPSREVTLLDDRSLPDPRDYRRRTNDLKDLVVRVSDVRRPPPAPPEAVHRSTGRFHRSSHNTDDGEDVVSSSSGGAGGGPQDPRLLHRRVPDEPLSSGDEHLPDSERLTKKPRYSEVNYEKPNCVKRVADSSDSMPNFRRPRDSRRDGRVNRRIGGELLPPSQEVLLQDPRYRRLSLPENDDVHWHRDSAGIHVSSSCDAAADHSDTSPPGTPVRDERDDSTDPPHHTLHHQHQHHHQPHHHRDRDRDNRYHSVPLSLPLPRFAQQVRLAHMSPRAASTSPKGSGNLLRSPPFTGGSNNTNTVKTDPKDLGSLILDTPLSPGPRESTSDSEESPLQSPCSPSMDLDQRIRALDEKYEKWSGSSRVIATSLSSTSNEIVNENSSSSVGSVGKNARLPRILDLEELRSQPSDILKTLLSKRSVFDEDSKRLENVGDKYEPKPFTAAPRTSKSVNLLPSPPLVSVAIPRQTALLPAVPSATPISSLPGVRLSSQQGQQPVTSSPSQVPRVCVSVPQVGKSQGSSPLHQSVVSQALRSPPTSSPGLSPGVGSPAHPPPPPLPPPPPPPPSAAVPLPPSPHLSPVTPQSPASCLSSTTTITTTTITSTTSSVTSLRRTPTHSRSLSSDTSACAGEEGDTSGTGVVTVVADTRVTGVVSVTQTVSSSKSVLSTTTSLIQPLSSPTTQLTIGDASYKVPERSSSDAFPLEIKEEPCPDEMIIGSPHQRLKSDRDPLGLEDIKTKDCSLDMKDCKEVMDFSVTEHINSRLKVEPIDLDDVKSEALKVESVKSDIKLESYVKLEMMKDEPVNKEMTNNHKRRHSSIDCDFQGKIDGKMIEPEIKRLKQDLDEERMHEKVASKERRDSRDARDSKKSESREKKTRGRREEVKESENEKMCSRTYDSLDSKQKRKMYDKVDDRKEEGHKKEEKKEKRREKLEDKPPDKLVPRDKVHETKSDIRGSDKITERTIEDKKEDRKEDKKEEKKEDERKDEKREERKENISEDRVKSESERRRHSEDKRIEIRDQKHKEKRDKVKDRERLKGVSSGSSKHEKDLEKERKDREKEKDKDRERIHEKERGKNHEMEREVNFEMTEKERDKPADKEKDKVVEKDRNKVSEKQVDKDRLEKERERLKFNDKCRERNIRLNHRDSTERIEGKKEQRHLNDHRNNDRRRDSRQEMRHYHHRSYEGSEMMDAAKVKSRKTHSLDAEDCDMVEQNKLNSSQYINSDDGLTNHDSSSLPGMNEVHDIGKVDISHELENRKVDRVRDPRRRKHDSGKSDKSDGEIRLKGNGNRIKYSPSHSSRLKGRTDSHEQQSATSDIPTSDDEVSQPKGVSLTARRNSSSNKHHQQPSQQMRISKNKHPSSNKSKSIFDPESDSGDSMIISGGEAEDGGDEAPKKHSIFDIPADDGMFDMYDKVKARRFKLQQKQEEERKQQEIKQSQLQKYRQLKVRKEKKVTTAISDISDTEEEEDHIGHGHKRSHIQHTSSEDDHMRKRRPTLLSADDTDDDLYLKQDKRKLSSSQVSHKKELKHKLKSVIVSDVTTDDDVPNLPRYPSNLKPSRVSDVTESNDSVRGCEDNIYTDSDAENEMPTCPRRLNKCLKQLESDSDISDIQSHAKPPKPAARVKVHDKGRKGCRVREKIKTVSKEMITTSEESDAAHTSEDARPHRLKVKSDQIEMRQEKALLPPQRERKRTGESSTREKVSSKRDERMEAIFGLISDDSDPAPPHPKERPASATARRKGSTSSGASTAPPPLSPAPVRISVREVYDSDSDDTGLSPVSPNRRDPLWLESKPDMKVDPRNKIDCRSDDRRSNMKRDRIRYDPLPPPPDVRPSMEVMKGNSSALSSNAKMTSPTECVSQNEVIQHSSRKEPESRDTLTMHVDPHDCTDEDAEEQRDTRKDKKKKKRHKDKDGSKSCRHHRHGSDKHAADQENDTRNLDHSSSLKINAVSPDNSHSNITAPMHSPRDRISKGALKSSSPRGLQTSSRSTDSTCLPHLHPGSSPSDSMSLPSPPPVKSGHNAREMQESQDSGESPDTKKVRSPHPLAALASDAAESAVQSLTTQVPPSSHESIFEDITEVSNLSAPETNAEVSNNTTNKASRAVISQEETLNAVAGLLACYDGYSDVDGVAPTDEETMLPPDTSAVSEDASEEAQKAAQMLQCEMPGEREESWSQQSTHAPPGGQPKPPSAETNAQLSAPQEEEEEQESTNDNQRFSQMSPDSPASMQSEPELQIDEDHLDPPDDMETHTSENMKLDNHVQDEDSRSSLHNLSWENSSCKSSPCKTPPGRPGVTGNLKHVLEQQSSHIEKVDSRPEKVKKEIPAKSNQSKRLLPVVPVLPHSQSSVVPANVTTATTDSSIVNKPVLKSPSTARTSETDYGKSKPVDPASSAGHTPSPSPTPSSGLLRGVSKVTSPKIETKQVSNSPYNQLPTSLLPLGTNTKSVVSGKPISETASSTSVPPSIVGKIEMSETSSVAATEPREISNKHSQSRSSTEIVHAGMKSSLLPSTALHHLIPGKPATPVVTSKSSSSISMTTPSVTNSRNLVTATTTTTTTTTASSSATVARLVTSAALTPSSPVTLSTTSSKPTGSLTPVNTSSVLPISSAAEKLIPSSANTASHIPVAVSTTQSVTLAKVAAVSEVTPSVLSCAPIPVTTQTVTTAHMPVFATSSAHKSPTPLSPNHLQVSPFSSKPMISHNLKSGGILPLHGQNTGLPGSAHTTELSSPQSRTLGASHNTQTPKPATSFHPETSESPILSPSTSVSLPSRHTPLKVTSTSSPVPVPSSLPVTSSVNSPLISASSAAGPAVPTSLPAPLAVGPTVPTSLPAPLAVGPTVPTSLPASLAVGPTVPTSLPASLLPTSICAPLITTANTPQISTPPSTSASVLPSSGLSLPLPAMPTLLAHQAPSAVQPKSLEKPSVSVAASVSLPPPVSSIAGSLASGTSYSPSVVSSSSKFVCSTVSDSTPKTPISSCVSVASGMQKTTTTSSSISTEASLPSHKTEEYPCVPISGPLPTSVPVAAVEPKTATEPMEVDTELGESKTIKCEPQESNENKSANDMPCDIKPKIIKEEKEIIKSEPPEVKNSDWSCKSASKQATENTAADDVVPKKEVLDVANASGTPVVEHALANLETIVSETAAQPRAEDISHPPTEEASLINNKKPGAQLQPLQTSAPAPPPPQDDFAKLERVCSEIQNENKNMPEIISSNEDVIETEEVIKIEEKVQERAATSSRGRRRGRGRRGGRQPVEVQPDDENSSLPLTRSGVSIRGKGRGRGRQTRNSESQQEVAEVKETALTEPRRSSRTKRARYHPDMVDHDETSGRKRRGRGGRNAQVEDSRPLRTTSDVYDFHESEDEDLNLALSKSTKINKKEGARAAAAAGRSPAKVDPEEVIAIDNNSDIRGGATTTTTRRSGRLRDKAVDDEPNNSKETIEDQMNNEPVIVLDTTTSLPSMPLSSAASVVPVNAPSLPVTTISRGRGRGKPREVEVDEDALLRKSPRGPIRTIDASLELEKPTGIALKGIPISSISYSTSPVTPTPASVITTAVTTTTPSATIVPVVEERKSEAELVDPVTGVVTRVKVCVEGQYVTDSGDAAVVPVSQVPQVPQVLDHKQVPEVCPMSPVVNYSNSNVSIVNVGSPVEKPIHTNPTSVGIRSGLTVTMVNSNNTRPITSAGKIGSDLSVELVSRPRAPIQVGRPAASVVSLPSSAGTPTNPINLQAAPAVVVPSLPSSGASLMTSTQSPIRAAVPTVVTLSGGLRPNTTLPLYITKAKTIPGQPQQPAQIHAHPQTLQQLQQHPMQQQQQQQQQHPMQQQQQQQQQQARPAPAKQIPGPNAPNKMTIMNPVIKATGAPGPPPTCYPPKTLVPSQAVPGPTQVHVRPTVVPKPNNPSIPPKPGDLQVKGGSIGPYEAAHRVGVAVDDGPHHRIYMDEQRGVHGEFVGVNVHPRYPNSRFLEPPRVDVSRLPGSSPSATSPAGRPPHEPEPHNPPPHPSVPGYERHAVPAAGVTHSHKGPAVVAAAAVAAAVPASSSPSPSSSSSVTAAPKGGMPPHHYYRAGDVGECQQQPVALHHPHHPSQLKAAGGGGGLVVGSGGGEHYLTSPPLSTPPSAHTPPPAHQHTLQDEMMLGVRAQYIPHVYPSQYYGAVDPRMYGKISGEKIITPIPIDMKIDMKLVEKSEPEKHEPSPVSGGSGGGSVGGAGTPGPPPEFAGRGTGGPANLAPRGQSSPHILASPHHDRSTDSPQVAMVYSRLYDRYYYPGRAATPGAPGTAEHEARSHISSPSAVAAAPHVYPNIPSAEVHHQPMVQMSSAQQFATQIPPQLQMQLQPSDMTWAGLLGLKQDHAAVQMYYVSGCSDVARGALPVHIDGTTSPIRIGQRMRLEQTQLEGVARKIQMEAEHCMLLALPHGRDSYDFVQQQNNLRNGIINYLVVKQAAGIVNVTAPGSQQPAYVVHIFPPCDFANENLARISPDLLHRVAEISYLLIVIATC